MKIFIRLACAAGVAIALYWFALRDGCGTNGAIECPAPELEEGVGVTLKASDICRRAGYLCVNRSRIQVARWPLENGRLRVRIAVPDFLDEDIAHRVHAAVIDGIKVWDGHPFPLVFDTGQFTTRFGDIRVIWTRGLRIEGAVGVGGLEWREDGRRIKVSSARMTVAVPPDTGTDAASLAYVRAVATHEMGHALGLYHSNREQDIMFPLIRTDAKSMGASARDFLTMDTLYTLPNGARLQ